MVKTQQPPQAFEDDSLEGSSLQNQADRALLIGCLLTATYILVFFAIPYFIRAYRLLRQAEREGTLTRPWAITIVGAFSLIETVFIVLFWPTMFFAHDSHVLTTLWTGYGKIADAGYYVDWNGASIGGTGQHPEWTIALIWTLFVAAPRVGASWFFLKMKRYGLQWMIITSYGSVAMMTGFVIENFLPWNARIGASEFGIVAWSLINLPFISGFVILPFLHQLNRERFSD